MAILQVDLVLQVLALQGLKCLPLAAKTLSPLHFLPSTPDAVHQDV